MVNSLLLFHPTPAFRAAIIVVTYVGWVKRLRTHRKKIVDGSASLDPSYSLKFLSI